jgi:hypothetical protein
MAPGATFLNGRPDVCCRDPNPLPREMLHTRPRTYRPGIALVHTDPYVSHGWRCGVDPYMRFQSCPSGRPDSPSRMKVLLLPKVLRDDVRVGEHGRA